MSQTIAAVQKSGSDFKDNQPVELRIKLRQKKEHPLMRFVGIMNDENATELSIIIEVEFEKVNSDEYYFVDRCTNYGTLLAWNRQILSLQ